MPDIPIVKTQRQYLQSIITALNNHCTFNIKDYEIDGKEQENKDHSSFPMIYTISPTPTNSIVIDKNEKEKALLEYTSDSIRLSFIFRKEDDLEALIVKHFCDYLMKRAYDLMIVQKIPIKDYDLSLLITCKHEKQLNLTELKGFIGWFLEEMDKRLSAEKILYNSDMRDAAKRFLTVE